MNISIVLSQLLILLTNENVALHSISDLSIECVDDL